MIYYISCIAISYLRLPWLPEGGDPGQIAPKLPSGLNRVHGVCGTFNYNTNNCLIAIFQVVAPTLMQCQYVVE